MAATLRFRRGSFPDAGIFLPGAALAAAALFLYAPIYIEFAAGPWRRDENAHALIIMAIALGAAGVRLRTETFPLNRTPTEQAVGFFAVLVGLAMIVAGRLADAELLLSASQPVVAAGIVLALYGTHGLKRLWFPLLLLSYLIIWPGWMLEAATAPLKEFVSRLVANGLYAAGLPAAHAGAVISVGPYQLLVAEACSGLNSLIALTAVGAVYLYAVKHGDWRVNAAVLVSLIPIAIIANIARVAILALITYFLGYDAGQGFMHDGAGLVMFMVALALVFLIDSIAVAVFARRAAQ